jgi:formiminotetrahydrofolate cyclodeaminase
VSTIPPAPWSPRELHDRIAAGDTGLAAGVVTALTAAAAAAVVERVAHASSGAWSDAGGASAQALALRQRAETLAAINADAFSDAVAELREPDPREQELRNVVLGAALTRAAEIPLRIAEVCADAAMLAEQAARHAGPDERPDAVAAAELAAGAARAAEHLVEANLVTREGDDLRRPARAARNRAAEAAARCRTAAH